MALHGGNTYHSYFNQSSTRIDFFMLAKVVVDLQGAIAPPFARRCAPPPSMWDGKML
jgi:hypothetical protein